MQVSSPDENVLGQTERVQHLTTMLDARQTSNDVVSQINSMGGKVV